MSTAVILDVDTGVDDALAILFAVAHPDLDVRGITCVAGNAGLDQVVANTLRILDAAGAPDVPVAAGARRPLIEAARSASQVHGADGLGGVELPASARASRAGERRQPDATTPAREPGSRDAGRAGPSDQPRPPAAHPPRGDTAHRAHRLHGRLGERRQRDGRRGVQRLARSRGRRHRARLRGAVLHVRTRRLQPRGRPLRDSDEHWRVDQMFAPGWSANCSGTASRRPATTRVSSATPAPCARSSIPVPSTRRCCPVRVELAGHLARSDRRGSSGGARRRPAARHRSARPWAWTWRSGSTPSGWCSSSSTQSHRSRGPTAPKNTPRTGRFSVSQPAPSPRTHGNMSAADPAAAPSSTHDRQKESDVSDLLPAVRPRGRHANPDVPVDAPSTAAPAITPAGSSSLRHRRPR